MQVHGTYYNGSEDISDGTMLIRMDYGARKRLGGMVRTDAFGARKPYISKVGWGFARRPTGG